jgi:hypothetical protein
MLRLGYISTLYVRHQLDKFKQLLHCIAFCDTML